MKNSIVNLTITVSFAFSIFSGCDMMLRQYSPTEPLPVELRYPGKLIVLVPSFADTWHQGTEVLIRWQTKSEIKQVNILLFRKSEMICTITTYSDNKSEYRWQIPVDLPNSVQYSIKIENSFNENEFSFSERFAIKKQG